MQLEQFGKFGKKVLTFGWASAKICLVLERKQRTNEQTEKRPLRQR